MWALVFSLYAMMHAVSPLLPLIMTDLGLSYGAGGFLYSLPIVVTMFVVLPLGMVSARYAVADTLGAGMAVAVAADIARIQPLGTAWLYGWTAMFGLGLGICYVNLPRFVKTHFPRHSDTATGVYISAMTIGIAASIGVTSPIREGLGLGWRGALGFWGVLGGVSLAVWLAISMWMRAYRGREGTDEAVPPTTGGRFGRHDRTAVRVGVIFGMLNLLFFGIMGWLPTYLVQHQWQIHRAALVAALIPLIEVPTVIVAPILSTRLGLRRPFIVGGFLMVGVALSVVTAFPMYAWFATPLVGIGLGVPFVLLLVIPTELVDVNARDMGRMVGVVFTVGYAGGVVGPVAVGAIRDVGGPFAIGLGILSAVALVAAILTRILPETGTRVEGRVRTPQPEGA